MSELNIAIAAEFELCEKIAECLQQSQLEIKKLSIIEIYSFNEEQGVRFNNRAVEQLKMEDAQWSDFDYLLFAGDINHAPHIAKAADAGCVVLDMKGICAMLSDVPLVVPTVNEGQLSELRQRNIVCLPEPQVSEAALTAGYLIENSSLNQIVVTSLLPASYVNTESVNQLAGQTARLLNGLPIEEEQQRLAFDVFPLETATLSAQLQKIFPQAERVVFHPIRVPVFYGMSQTITVLSDYALDSDGLLAAWQNNDLLQYEDSLITPVTNGEKENGEQAVKLHIGNLKALENSIENGVEFWTVADDQRFNLALLGVKLLKTVYLQGY